LGLFKALMPDDTEWTRWGGSLTADGPVRPQEPSVAVLARTISRVQRRDFDLIVLPAIHPQHAYGQPGYKGGEISAARRCSLVPRS
jgi:hypothetical protein